MSKLFKDNDYRILYHAHSHPGGLLNPSPGDINTVGVLFGRKKINSPFETYFMGLYQKFDHNSSSFEMEEMIITAPKKSAPKKKIKE